MCLVDTQMTRYYAYYSNSARGKRNKRDEEQQVTIELPEPVQRVPLSVRKAWARLIAKIYEINPLLCPHCGGEMKIVKFVEQEEDIRSMLALLGIPYQPRGQPAPYDQLINQDYVILPDGEPFYHED